MFGRGPPGRSGWSKCIGKRSGAGDAGSTGLLRALNLGKALKVLLTPAHCITLIQSDGQSPIVPSFRWFPCVTPGLVLLTALKIERGVERSPARYSQGTDCPSG